MDCLNKCGLGPKDGYEDLNAIGQVCMMEIQQGIWRKRNGQSTGDKETVVDLKEFLLKR